MPDNTPRKAQQNGTLLTAYPLQSFPGWIYWRKAMPSGLYDPEGTLLPEWRAAAIHTEAWWSCWPELMNAGSGRWDLPAFRTSRGRPSVLLAADSPTTGVPVDGRVSDVIIGAEAGRTGAQSSSTVPPDSDRTGNLL